MEHGVQELVDEVTAGIGLEGGLHAFPVLSEVCHQTVERPCTVSKMRIDQSETAVEYGDRACHAGFGKSGGGNDAMRGPAGMNAFHQRSRSEKHTSELQSLMRISYAVFCLKK